MFRCVSILIFLTIPLMSVYITRVSAENVHCRPLELLNHCKENETCVQSPVEPQSGLCKCKLGFKKDGNKCIPIPSQSAMNINSASTAQADVQRGVGEISILWWIIPICALITIGLCTFASKRYMWMARLYQMRVRRYNNVLVTSQGEEDDPPIE